MEALKDDKTVMNYMRSIGAGGGDDGLRSCRA